MSTITHYAKFIKVKTIVNANRNSDGKPVWVKSKSAINPMDISSYSPLVFEEQGEKYDLTVVNVGGYSLWVDIPFKKFDKFFDDVHRGVEAKEEF